MQLNYTIIGIAVFSENKKPPAFANRRWWLFDLLSLGVLLRYAPFDTLRYSGSDAEGAVFHSAVFRLPSPFAN
jgi:hypothetical protein